MKDYALIALSYDNSIRIYVGNTTNLVKEACKIHDTWPSASIAFGRLLSITSLYGLMYKDALNVSVSIKSEGPIQRMVSETFGNGIVRGDISNPNVFLETKDHIIDVGNAVGPGTLTVVRNSGLKDMFSSSVDLQTGEIASDFSAYFALSEQIPSAVGAGVLVNDSNQKIIVSGAYIIQVLPNCPDATLKKIEEIINTTPSLTKLLQDNKTPEEILSIFANGTEKILSKVELKYHCPCTKEHYRKSIASLDLGTLKEILYEDKGAEVICHYCHKKYEFSEDEIKDMIKNYL